MTGSGSISRNGRREVPDRADGGRQPRHGLDLERDRQAARRVEPRARTRPRRAQGFLLNHVIGERCLPRTATLFSNSDPMTGQAAWYDLRVRVEKCAPARGGRDRAAARRAAPCRPACRARRASCATTPSYPGERAMTAIPTPAARPEEARPGDRPRHLRRLPCLRGELQGMERERPFRAADRFQRLPGEAGGRVVQPHPQLRGGRGGGEPHRAFPALLPALRGARLRRRCAPPAPPTSAPRTASCW